MSPAEQILRQLETPRKPASPPVAPIYEVGVARLCDGRLSVRVDGGEVALLPRKADCAEDDLLRAFLALARAVDEIVRDAVDPDPDVAREEILSEMSW